MRTHADTEAALLTEAQNAAIYTTDRSVAVVAGAGSGKTTVLIDRCLHIIGDDWGEIDRMLAITFTEKAAGELKRRMRPHMPPADRYRLENAWIGTFHSCLARMLRQHAPLVGMDPSFDILDENAARLLSQEAIKSTLLNLLHAGDEAASFLVGEIDFKTSVRVLTDLMAFRYHARKALSKKLPESAEDSKIVNAMAKVYRAAEENLSERFARLGALDFQELEIRALDLLSDNPDVLASYRERFRHLLVDEFQDTNDLQTEFILRMYDPERNHLCIVGDPRQSIYRFRGANIDCFARMLGIIRKTGGESIDLLDNFRSAPGIVEFVNRCQEVLAHGLFGNLTAGQIAVDRELMRAARKEFKPGPSVIRIPIELSDDARVAERRRTEAGAIADYILQLTSSGDAKIGEIVCLFQALTGVTPYEIAFKAAGIPYLIFGGRGLLERQEIKDLFAVLCYAADPSDDMALLALMRSPLIALSDDDLVTLAGPDGGGLTANAIRDSRCTVLNEIIRMAEHARPSEILRRAVAATDYEYICGMLDASGGMNANVERFIALVASIERQEPTTVRDMADFITMLRENSARIGDPPAAGDVSNAVRMMTVHAAKGLQFPVVILPDLFRKPRPSGGKWQFTREDGIAFKMRDEAHPLGERIDIERCREIREGDRLSSSSESQRLLYVAMTRAQDRLVLPVHASFEGHGSWHEWIEPVVKKAAKDDIISTWEPAKARPDASGAGISPAGPVILKPMSASGRAHDAFTVSQLECYYRCPHEYYLKYELMLPSSDIFKEEGEKLPANIFGSIVHGVLERHRADSKTDLPTIIRTACISNGILPDASVLKQIKKSIDDFEKLPIARETGKGSREVRFDWNFDGRIISGSIDWLRPVGGGFEVVDFKTDHIKPDQMRERAGEYDLQLICYALAAEAALSARIESTALIFLMIGETFAIPMTDGRRDDGRTTVSRIIRSIDREDFDIAGKTAPCYKCPYRHNRMCWLAK